MEEEDPKVIRAEIGFACGRRSSVAYSFFERGEMRRDRF